MNAVLQCTRDFLAWQAQLVINSADKVTAGIFYARFRKTFIMRWRTITRDIYWFVIDNGFIIVYRGRMNDYVCTESHEHNVLRFPFLLNKLVHSISTCRVLYVLVGRKT